MSYIEDIVKEINLSPFNRKLNEQLNYKHNFVADIIAKHIAASSLDKQYIIDAKKYLEEWDNYSPDADAQL